MEIGVTQGPEERWVRRLDIAARRIWSQYYSTSEMRDTLGPLEVFLAAATAALDAGISPTDLATELQKHMLDSSERLDYHLDGDLPMVMYRLWLRGRAIDVYERDMFHTPRWIELIRETKLQMAARPDLVSSGIGGMGTICYPNGESFEGEVDSLIRCAKGRTAGFSSAAAAAVDAEVVSSNGEPLCDQLSGEAEEQVLEVSHDVRTVSGLVALVTECMDSGLSDEATIMKRHMRSPDFGHPLLVLATRTGEDDDWPHMPDEDEVDPAHLTAEMALTAEHIALGERGAKEMIHDRRRSHLDVYLICAAYRAIQAAAAGVTVTAQPEFGLCDEDAHILNEMLKQAALI